METLKPCIIVLEGIIGAGKSTLCEVIKHVFNNKTEVVVLEEPLNANNAMLKLFLTNPEKYAFAFQTYAMQLRHRQYIQAIQAVKNGKIAIIDRSFDGDRAFERKFYNEGIITQQEHDTYEQTHNDNKMTLPEPNHIIYLEVPVDIALERIKERGRLNEVDCYDRNYLERLNNAYNETFANNTKVKRVTSKHIDALSGVNKRISDACGEATIILKECGII
jgi:deoxyadenosine/deoxycytidine kinase